MSTPSDPRTAGLEVPARPAPRSTSVAPPPLPAPAAPAPETTSPAQTPSEGSRGAVAPSPAASGAASPAARAPRRQGRGGAPGKPPEPPRVGSWRGGSVQVATSIPYATATALDAKAESDDVTLGSLVMEAVRAQAPFFVTNPPPRPRRSGGTAVRQFLVSPSDAEVLADFLDQVASSERMTVSLLLRHCLGRHLE